MRKAILFAVAQTRSRQYQPLSFHIRHQGTNVPIYFKSQRQYVELISHSLAHQKVGFPLIQQPPEEPADRNKCA
jgi:hypothetical protein